MRKNFTIGLLVAGLVLGVAIGTNINARIREGKVNAIKAGMHRSEVERLLGAGKPDVSSPSCKKCKKKRSQFYYYGNPSLWYGRLEDTLIVCYFEDVVCDTTRYGL